MPRRSPTGMTRWLRPGVISRAMRRRLPVAAFTLLVGVSLALLYAVGAIEPLDRILFEQRLSWLKRPASNSLVVVEIDAASIRELDSWPWPRRYHAQAIDRLVAAGATQIAIDVDFSARSDPAEDAALAAAIARAGSKLILPSFVQGATAHDRTTLTESAPQAGLIGPATAIASVNVSSDSDGRIWRYAIGLEVAGTFRPSLAALLAGSATYASQSFYVDYSIRESTFATLSFADIVAGRFDPALVANRKVIIGATATELGDIKAVPVYRTLAGVFIHALAYETLVQGRAIFRVAVGVTVAGLFALLVAMHLAARRRRQDWKRNLLLILATAVTIVSASVVVQEAAAVALDVAVWLVALMVWSASQLIHALQSQSHRLLRRHFRAVQQRRMMRAIVESSFDGIIVVDERRHIAHANPMATEILGRALDSLIGTPLDRLLPADAIARRRRREDESPGGDDHQLTRPDGRIVFIEIVSRDLKMTEAPDDPAMSTSQPMTVVTFRDVTERRRALAALNDALTEAQSASRLKSEFLAAMGHELRTPLNAILGFSEMIRDRRLGSALDRYVDYAREIHVSGQRLSTLVETILDFAQIVSGKLRLDKQSIDLEAVLRGSVDAFMPLAAERHLRLEMPKPTIKLPSLVADEQRIHEIASHLLSNGLKFTARGGSVAVLILAREDAAGFEVRDTGIGMTEAQIAVALSPFTQVDGRIQRRHEGAGLGLSFAMKLVELHGGTLTIDSAPDAGTSVRVWFPLAQTTRIAA